MATRDVVLPPDPEALRKLSISDLIALADGFRAGSDGVQSVMNQTRSGGKPSDILDDYWDSFLGLWEIVADEIAGRVPDNDDAHIWAEFMAIHHARREEWAKLAAVVCGQIGGVHA